MLRSGKAAPIFYHCRATDAADSCGLCAPSPCRETRRGVRAALSLDNTGLLEQGKGRDLDVIALDDSLKELAKIDPRKAQVVELRFFGGLNFDETAEVLKVSAVTVARDWSTARAWLHREMSRGNSDGR
jgi:DNA-directed RNA polymerase specialized sigma24 family protein